MLIVLSYFFAWSMSYSERSYIIYSLLKVLLYLIRNTYLRVKHYTTSILLIRTNAVVNRLFWRHYHLHSIFINFLTWQIRAKTSMAKALFWLQTFSQKLQIFRTSNQFLYTKVTILILLLHSSLFFQLGLPKKIS